MYFPGFGAEELTFSQLCLAFAPEVLPLDLQKDSAGVRVLYASPPRAVGYRGWWDEPIPMESLPGFRQEYLDFRRRYPGNLTAASHVNELQAELTAYRDSLRRFAVVGHGAIWRRTTAYDLYRSSYDVNRCGFTLWGWDEAYKAGEYDLLYMGGAPRPGSHPGLVPCGPERADSVLALHAGKIPGTEIKYFVARSSDEASGVSQTTERDAAWPDETYDLGYRIAPRLVEIARQWVPKDRYEGVPGLAMVFENAETLVPAARQALTLVGPASRKPMTTLKCR